MKNQPVLERFMEKVVKDVSTECWNFISSIGRTGCGRFFYNGKCRDAYRVGYELLVRPLAKFEHLHHKCENRQCVNPEHLQATTPKIHFGDLSPTHIAYINKHKTHCPQGHLLIESNLVVSRFKKNGVRICLACARKRSRECQARLRHMSEPN